LHGFSTWCAGDIEQESPAMDGFRDALPPMDLAAAASWSITSGELAKPQKSRSRPVSARPGSRRFLQDTLVRLGEDSLRVGRRLHELRGTSAMSEAAGLTDAGPSWEWHPSEDRSHSPVPSPGVRSGLEPDTRANEASLVSGLSQEAFQAERVCHSLLSVATVVSNWESEVRSAAENWGHLVERQEDAIEKEVERWMKLGTRLDRVDERIGELTTEIRGHSSIMQDFHVAQHRFNKRFETMVEAAIQRITLETSRTTETVAASLREQAVADCEAVKKHAESLVVGEHDGMTELAAGSATSPFCESPRSGPRTPVDREGDEAEPQAAVLPRLRIIDERMRKIDDESVKNFEEWREDSRKWQQGRDEAVLELDRVHKLLNDAQDEVKHLEAHTLKLDEQVADLQETLAECRKNPAGQALQRVREIEARGNCRVDRLSGSLELLRPVEFSTRRPTESPRAELKDASLAANVLMDVAEIWNLFGGPLELQVYSRTGRGGSAAFWDQLSTLRAELLRSRLEENGVPSHFINARKVVGGKGLTTQVLMRLGRDVFPGYLGGRETTSGRGNSVGRNW